ncbi:MAG: adenylosuccinate synthase [Gemmataceae bacterium]|nr:adenylosuccinate synthase [Gemmataceae bacterium]
MACTCVVGLQWGDEAKGKVVDILTDTHDLVVRYNGGPNAGHTVVAGNKTFKLSILPTGVIKPKVKSVIGNGVVIFPARLREEIAQLQKNGIETGDNLVISDRAHVIFPYHLEQEKITESNEGTGIGTTGRGIGPCYQDKVGRVHAIRTGELVRPIHLEERLRQILDFKNRLLRGFNPNAVQFDARELAKEYAEHGEFLKPHLADTTRLLHEALAAGKNILFEGAQGSLLDVDHGSYPFVTSSNSTTAGIASGTGIPPRHINRVIGILKAYTTRVGKGPFPTELNDGPEGLGERIRKVGREYGTVTGRPRRCGWFDAVAAAHSAQINGVDEITIMLLDVLSGLGKLKIATAYELDGERIKHFPTDAGELQRCQPVYETVEGWSEPIEDARKLADLPLGARKYADRIGEILQLPVKLISVGPDRVQTIFTVQG